MHTVCSFFFFNDTATTEIYTLSLHDALPIYPGGGPGVSALPIYGDKGEGRGTLRAPAGVSALERTSPFSPLPRISDRKSTRLNSSHLVISYAVFCLKKKKRTYTHAPHSTTSR